MASEHCSAILVYHGVAPEHPECVSPENFSRQIRYLVDNYHLVDVAQVFNNKKEIQKSKVAITFDDAYRNILDYALPVLSQYMVPATIYAPTSYLGKKNEWDYGSSMPLCSIMNSEELREVSNMGFEIGSHTQNHLRLRGLASIHLVREIRDSKKILEDIIGHSVNSFAYPHGGRIDLDHNAINMVRESGYHSGLTTFFGRHNDYYTRFKARRIIVDPNDSIKSLNLKLNGYYDWLIPKEIMAYYAKLILRIGFTR